VQDRGVEIMRNYADALEDAARKIRDAVFELMVKI
jgi:hypothetical protein